MDTFRNQDTKANRNKGRKEFKEQGVDYLGETTTSEATADLGGRKEEQRRGEEKETRARHPTEATPRFQFEISDPYCGTLGEVKDTILLRKRNISDTCVFFNVSCQTTATINAERTQMYQVVHIKIMNE